MTKQRAPVRRERRGTGGPRGGASHGQTNQTTYSPGQRGDRLPTDAATILCSRLLSNLCRSVDWSAATTVGSRASCIHPVARSGWPSRRPQRHSQGSRAQCSSQSAPDVDFIGSSAQQPTPPQKNCPPACLLAERPGPGTRSSNVRARPLGPERRGGARARWRKGQRLPRDRRRGATARGSCTA